MDAKLILALELNKGRQIPDEAHDIEVGHEDISFYNEAGKYLRGAYFDFDNEWLGHDNWAIAVEGTHEFTVEEFNTWLGENLSAVVQFERDRQEAISTVALLVEGVESGLNDGLALAKKFGIPFTLDVAGEAVDLRKLVMVDWDSSSMHC